MQNLSQRKEHDLELDIGEGREYFDFRRLAGGHPPENRWGIPNGEFLTNFISDAREKPEFARYFHPNPQTGHFLIDMAGVNQAWPVDGAGMLNEKAVFHLNSSLPINGRFYTSDPDEDHTMMVYVGPNGILDNFGSYGDFRGLVYVHPDNNHNHTFQWRAEGTLEGAILFNGGKDLYWNDQSHFTTIRRNDDAITDFGNMLKIRGTDDFVGGTSQGDELIAIPNQNINLRQLGVYFH
jgi:hypothetical protein